MHAKFSFLFDFVPHLFIHNFVESESERVSLDFGIVSRECWLHWMCTRTTYSYTTYSDADVLSAFAHWMCIFDFYRVPECHINKPIMSSPKCRSELVGDLRRCNKMLATQHHTHRPHRMVHPMANSNSNNNIQISTQAPALHPIQCMARHIPPHRRRTQ